MKTFTVVCCEPDCPNTIDIAVDENDAVREQEAVRIRLSFTTDNIITTDDNPVVEDGDKLAAQFSAYSDKVEQAGWVNDGAYLAEHGRPSPNPYGWKDITWRCPACQDALITAIEYSVARAKGQIN
jgi:hypothetical protein